MRKLIIIFVMLMCVNLNAGTLRQRAVESIKNAEEIIQEASEGIPFKFNIDIRQRIGEADNSLAIAKKEFNNKKYSRAIARANNAEVLSAEAMEISTELVNQMESEITDKINSLKGKDNNEIVNVMIFEAENYCQQKNYYECIKKIEEIKNYKYDMRPVKKLIWKQKIETVPKKVKKIRKAKKILKNYQVQYGDNLWSIAKKKYGNGMKWVKIYRANKNIKNINLIYPGQLLILPKN